MFYSCRASLSPGKCRSPAFRVFLRLCAVTCCADGGSRCGGAAGCSASVCGAPPSLRTPRPAQRPLTPAPALPESGGIRRPACLPGENLEAAPRVDLRCAVANEE
ncbi:hypothetical protein G5714_006438 [Onychostoma macrolepis]|uniref:Uncharacterized protein n=1 Tax=Onychostoma macrolepis TaxID=369639 RepID=A0A7J6D3U6_9TELE|nr:hypothetical protein G5714_006438 [Onychostoma macrolepis]